MAGFDSHSKCARCRDKGLGDDPCILKKECLICKRFTPEQVLQLATPTYKDRKEKVKAVQSTPTKKTKCTESPKPSASRKRSSSSKPSSEDLKQLDDKWAERFSRLEAMLLAKTFTVPVPALTRLPVLL